MTGTQASDAATKGRARRELAGLLLLGAVGSGLALFALHQSWARVVMVPPSPLPASSIGVTGQSLLPAAAALALAALASLAAVIATRRAARRITGGITAVLGVGVGVLAAGHLSAATALASVHQGPAGPAGGAGSVTGGNGAGGSSGGSLPVTGTATHVLFTATGWRDLAVAGALAVIAAGILIVMRANDLPEMSSRYDRAARTVEVRRATPAGADRALDLAPDQARLWESLSAGDDPTG